MTDTPHELYGLRDSDISGLDKLSLGDVVTLELSAIVSSQSIGDGGETMTTLRIEGGSITKVGRSVKRAFEVAKNEVSSVEPACSAP